MKLYIGIVEDRDDPLKLGRVKVRVIGLHTLDKSDANGIPTSDLPWAVVMQSVNSGGTNGIGMTPNFLLLKSSVLITFLDSYEQVPIVIGCLLGMNEGGNNITKSTLVSIDNTNKKLLNIINGNTGGLVVGNTIEGVGIEKDTKIVNINTNSITLDKDVNSEGTIIINNAQHPIPTIPPKGSTTNVELASNVIKSIISNCDKVGLVHKQQKCAILAVVGKECNWIPQDEEYNYSPNRLQQILSSINNDDIDKYKYAKNRGVSRYDFFSWLYGTTLRGNNFLGNTNDSDGGMYYGRGLIQLTGKSNYLIINSYLKKYVNVDIVKTPSILNTDIDISSLATVLYIKNRIKDHNDLNNYLGSVLKSVGNQVGNSYEICKKYYDYFLDNQSINESNNNDYTDTGITNILNGIEDNTSNISNNYNNSVSGDSDINKIAMGIYDGTNLELYNNLRETEIPIGSNKKTWAQPEILNASQYPYNKVIQTESGHVIELDDTKGNEHIRISHNSGSTIHIDNNGTRIDYTVGDKYSIIASNNSVYIKGECNVTIDGDCNIFTRSNTNIEVSNDANVVVGNNLSIHGKNISIDSTKFTVNTEELYLNSNKITKINGNKISLVGNSINTNIPIIRIYDAYINTTIPTYNIYPPLFPNIPYNIKIYHDEHTMLLETPIDWQTGYGKDVKSKLSNDIKYTKQSESNIITNNNIIEEDISKDIVNDDYEYTDNYMLSPNFSLGMLIKGGVFGRNKLEPVVQNGKTYSKKDIVSNLSYLCVNVLEKCLLTLPNGIDGYNKYWMINSGFRNRNNSIGVTNSQHNIGQAVDLSIINDKVLSNYNYINAISKLIPFDQLLLEYRSPNSNWIHVSYKYKNNRYNSFTMLNDTFYDNKFILFE